ncbi:MAG: formylglycine-generating enzyme family protein [Bacteroidales bacterium]|jgi:formylglycine-generating enzyme required for sulfatase activity|nr:formylglycine-generating enzyme family protein [Bacteroidales bacterium]
MKKLKEMLLGLIALSVMFAAGMLLVGCDKGNGEDDGDGNGNSNSNGNTTANGVSFDMVKVDGGTFTMGGTSEQGEDAFHDGEKPTHQVTLSDFSISSTEVTQALWKAVMGGWSHEEDNPDYTWQEEGTTYSYGKGDNYPMYWVSWNDIVGTAASDTGYTINGVTYYKNGFCYKLSELVGDGKQFRLPTEAEWEYAARGGSAAEIQTKYSGSNNIDDVAWYWKDSDGDGENDNGIGLHEVGKKKANALVLYDMSGNVFEWCSDWWGDYSSDSQTNPVGPAYGSRQRVIRGGCSRSFALYCRVSSRYYKYLPSLGYPDVGFRLAL